MKKATIIIKTEEDNKSRIDQAATRLGLTRNGFIMMATMKEVEAMEGARCQPTQIN